MCMNENDLTVAIITPKTGSGFFTALSFKSFLEKRGINGTLVKTPLTIEVQPSQLDRLMIPREIKTLLIGDLGYKNCDPRAISEFVKKHKSKIYVWADVHPKLDYIPELFGESIYWHEPDEKAPSVTALLHKLWGDKMVNKEWAQAANYLDNQAKNSLHPLAEDFRKLMFVAKNEDDSLTTKNYSAKLRELYSDYLLGHSDRAKLVPLFGEYYTIKHATIAALENITLLDPETPGIYLVNATGQIEKSAIVEAIKKKSKKYVVAIQHQTITNGPATAIYSHPEINLYPIFTDAKCHNKKVNQVCLCGNHQEVLKNFSDLVKKIEIN